jgi:hypothetical protein
VAHACCWTAAQPPVLVPAIRVVHSTGMLWTGIYTKCCRRASRTSLIALCEGWPHRTPGCQPQVHIQPCPQCLSGLGSSPARPWMRPDTGARTQFYLGRHDHAGGRVPDALAPARMRTGGHPCAREGSGIPKPAAIHDFSRSSFWKGGTSCTKFVPVEAQLQPPPVIALLSPLKHTPT